MIILDKSDTSKFTTEKLTMHYCITAYLHTIYMKGK